MASKRKRKRTSPDLVALWRGKVAQVLGQGSDSEVRTLFRLVWHRKLTHEQKYLVLEGAIFDVWSSRLADREEEAKVRRKRAREQSRQEREFGGPAESPSAPLTDRPEPIEPLDRFSVPEHPLGSGPKSE